jgi:ribosomal protein S20
LIVHDDMTQRLVTAAALCVVLTGGLSGCRHKQPPVTPLPQITTPVAIETPPPPEKPPVIETPPVKLPPTPVAAAAAKPKKERKKQPVAAAPAPTPPVQVASVEPATEGSAIGALTAGGEANPRMQQEAADLIAANEKRLNALPAQVSDEQKAQISKVKNFQRQAQDALNSGDAEGAKTLATKAKLLLDDLAKG